MSDSEKITQLLQEVQHLSSTLQSEAAFYSGRSITVKQKGKERKAGKLVTIRLIKNKVAPPRPTISKCPVYFNPKFHEVGFDRCYALEDVLVEK